MRYIVLGVQITAGGFKVKDRSDWYPRVVEADTPEDAVDTMYEQPRFAGEKQFLVLPVDETATVIKVKPRREFDYTSEELGSRILRGR